LALEVPSKRPELAIKKNAKPLEWCDFGGVVLLKCKIDPFFPSQNAVCHTISAYSRGQHSLPRELKKTTSSQHWSVSGYHKPPRATGHLSPPVLMLNQNKTGCNNLQGRGTVGQVVRDVPGALGPTGTKGSKEEDNQDNASA